MHPLGSLAASFACMTENSGAPVLSGLWPLASGTCFAFASAKALISLSRVASSWLSPDEFAKFSTPEFVAETG